jgi:hypothetical protein
MKKLQAKLNYANVMATIALFVALGGSAYAAGKLPRNSVGTKQLKASSVTTAKLKNGAITTAKIKDGAITGAKVDLTSLGTVPSATSATTATSATNAAKAANAANASALGGSPPSAFAPSTVLRSATVNALGILVAAKSDGVSGSNFGVFGTGWYCFKGFNPAPRTAVASISTEAEQGSTVATDVGAPGAECQVNVYTYNALAEDAPAPFSVIIH